MTQTARVALRKTSLVQNWVGYTVQLEVCHSKMRVATVHVSGGKIGLQVFYHIKVGL